MDRFDIIDIISTLFTGGPTTGRKRAWIVWGSTIGFVIVLIAIFTALDAWGVI